MRQLVVSVGDVVRFLSAGETLDHVAQGSQASVDLRAFFDALCGSVLFVVAL